MFHLLGYTHGELPDPAYGCTLACTNPNENQKLFFNDENNIPMEEKRAALTVGIGAGEKICETANKLDGNTSIKDHLVVLKSYYSEGGATNMAIAQVSENYFIFDNTDFPNFSQNIFENVILKNQGTNSVCRNPNNSSKSCFDSILDKIFGNKSGDNIIVPSDSWGSQMISNLALFGGNYSKSDGTTIGVRTILNNYAGKNFIDKFRDVGQFIKDSDQEGYVESFMTLFDSVFNENIKIKDKIDDLEKRKAPVSSVLREKLEKTKRQGLFLSNTMTKYCRIQYVKPNLNQELKSICSKTIRMGYFSFFNN